VLNDSSQYGALVRVLRLQAVITDVAIAIAIEDVVEAELPDAAAAEALPRLMKIRSAPPLRLTILSSHPLLWSLSTPVLLNIQRPLLTFFSSLHSSTTLLVTLGDRKEKNGEYCCPSPRLLYTSSITTAPPWHTPPGFPSISALATTTYLLVSTCRPSNTLQRPGSSYYF
jgi:hypothetical protein